MPDNEVVCSCPARQNEKSSFHFLLIGLKTAAEARRASPLGRTFGKDGIRGNKQMSSALRILKAGGQPQTDETDGSVREMISSHFFNIQAVIQERQTGFLFQTILMTNIV